VNILVTGASGNLGSKTVRHLLLSSHRLGLLRHKTDLPAEISRHSNVATFQADLGCPETLFSLCSGIDCIVHLAGVLFSPRPQKFLPKANIEYVVNLTQAALRAGVRKFVLVSFPHVEGETTPQNPAHGRMDANPNVIHFRTRLEAERQLVRITEGTCLTPVILRAGIVYGSGVKLIEAARWMFRHRLMAIWRKPIWAHLLALPDFLTALQVVIENETAEGIHQVCDDGPLLLQDFLYRLADHWNCRGPIRLPDWSFRMAAAICETTALLLGTATPLNHDILNAGMTSCVADTTRVKRELLPQFAYPTINEGLALL
jgi:nucleoside-diphosphate-sugar epimerase